MKSASGNRGALSCVWGLSTRQAEDDGFFFFLSHFIFPQKSPERSHRGRMSQNQPIVEPEQAVTVPFAAVIVDVRPIPDAAGVLRKEAAVIVRHKPADAQSGPTNRLNTDTFCISDCQK